MWTINNNDVELATAMFGAGGTQADRRWFYRLLDSPDWRRKGRRADMRLVLYFQFAWRPNLAFLDSAQVVE